MKYLITTLRVLPFVVLAGLVQSTGLQGADAPKGAKEAPKKQERPGVPARPFDAPGTPKFTRFDGKPGANPPVDVDGDFLVGPEYVAAPETKAVAGVPQGKVEQFVMDSKDCKLFNPGIARKVLVHPIPKTLRLSSLRLTTSITNAPSPCIFPLSINPALLHLCSSPMMAPVLASQI